MARTILYTRKSSNNYSEMENVNDSPSMNQEKINNIVLYKLNKIINILEGHLGK
tara:strand:+ start:208 stop:369 length:162 start_codon:yes stop_codon:yes gene_type:complete